MSIGEFLQLTLKMFDLLTNFLMPVVKGLTCDLVRSYVSSGNNGMNIFEPRFGIIKIRIEIQGRKKGCQLQFSVLHQILELIPESVNGRGLVGKGRIVSETELFQGLLGTLVLLEPFLKLVLRRLVLF